MASGDQLPPPPPPTSNAEIAPPTTGWDAPSPDALILAQASTVAQELLDTPPINAEDARDDVDSLLEREELVRQVVELSRGSVGFSTYLSREAGVALQKGAEARGRLQYFRPVSGYNTFGDRGARADQDRPPFVDMGMTDLGQSVNNKPPAEAVAFVPRVTKEMVDGMVPGVVDVKGRLGKVRQENGQVPGKVPTGRLIEVPHSEVVPGGVSEPSVRITYGFCSNSLPWLDMGNRSGRSTSIGWDLPKSEADLLRKRVEEEPGVIRDIVSGIMVDLGMPEDVWQNGIDQPGANRHKFAVRPPYEGLPVEHQLRIVDASVNPQTTRPVAQATTAVSFS